MNPRVPIVIGVAGMLAAIGTAIANANGAFVGHPHLHLWFYAAATILIATAIVLAFTHVEQKVPRIVATRYGEGRMGTAIHSHGYPAGKSGVILVNDGEPAYEIGVYPSFIKIGEFKLHFENTVRRLTKDDGEAQLSTWIEQSESFGVLGSGLFEFMRQNQLEDLAIPIQYKDSTERWYKTMCDIKRDVVHTRDGLLVRSRFKGRAWKPKT